MGRRATSSAFHCATDARYSSLPPRVAALRRSSREIVDGDRPISRAISRTPLPSARNSAISSRSAKHRYRHETGSRRSVAIPPRSRNHRTPAADETPTAAAASSRSGSPHRAESQRRLALSRSLATEAVDKLDQDVQLAALLSLEAYRAKPTIEARSAVLAVLPWVEGVRGSLTGHTKPVLGVAFSPDGKTLATASDDMAVRLWDVASGRARGQPLEGHTGLVLAVAFSRDGKTLATASEDNTARLWDVATRRALGQPLDGHTGPVGGVAFSRDGKTLATASEDKTVRLWNAILWSSSPRALVGRVCAAVTRNLRPAEWREFVPGDKYHATCRHR